MRFRKVLLLAALAACLTACAKSPMSSDGDGANLGDADGAPAALARVSQADMAVDKDSNNTVNIFPVSASYLDVGYSESSPCEDRIFRSRSELDEFITEVIMPCYMNTDGITNLLDGFDDTFFEDKLLYYHTISYPQSSYEFEYVGTVYDRDTDKAKVIWYTVEEGDGEAPSQYCFVTQLPKKDIPDSAEILHVSL